MKKLVGITGKQSDEFYFVNKNSYVPCESPAATEAYITHGICVPTACQAGYKLHTSNCTENTAIGYYDDDTGIPTRIIVGSVVGGVVLLILIALTILWIRATKSAEEKEDETNSRKHEMKHAPDFD